MSRALGVTLAAPGEIVGSSSGVWVSYFDGGAALSEYLMRKVRLGRLAQKLFDHPLYGAFVQAAPGVKELMAIGKVRDELLLQRRWDAVVVDAGASGHALEFLRMPAATMATFHRGRVHREARRVEIMLADPALTAVHVVATAEEMPSAEAIDTSRRIREELRLPLGHVLVNRCLPPAPGGIDAAIAQLARLSPDDSRARQTQRQMLQCARHALGFVAIQERCIADMEAGLGGSLLRLPLLTESPLTPTAVGKLADLLEEALS